MKPRLLRRTGWATLRPRPLGVTTEPGSPRANRDQWQEQPRHRPRPQPHQCCSQGKREMLETVAEWHVKILPEPSLQLSGDVRSASPPGRGQTTPRRLRACQQTPATAQARGGAAQRAAANALGLNRGAAVAPVHPAARAGAASAGSNVPVAPAPQPRVRCVHQG